ncbi:hypothetical protein [uncultured Sphingobacterium sp.]|jgi:hypothetical protein|uniref:hypothetical protein n=1 Tax=uncultured Sphingobacterium sp. TaxID=182688 RepID=UPI003748A4E3
MKRLYILFSFALLFSATMIAKAGLSPDKSYSKQLIYTLPDNVRKYITQLAISDGLAKNSIKIKTRQLERDWWRD